MIIYVKPSCVGSLATLRAIEGRGIGYTVLDLAESHFALEYVKTLGFSLTPIVVTKDGHWSGFRPDKIDDYVASIT